MILSTGQISVANNKVFCKLGNNEIRDLTQDTAYVHPATKQCNYTYTHPSTPQCNVSSRLDTIENKVNTTSGVPRWYFSSNSTWNCSQAGTYTFILVGGGEGWHETSIGVNINGHSGEYIVTTASVTVGNYTIIIGEAGIDDSNSSTSRRGGTTSISGNSLSISARGGGNVTNTPQGSDGGYSPGTLVGSGTVGRGGRGGNHTLISNAQPGACAIY